MTIMIEIENIQLNNTHYLETRVPGILLCIHLRTSNTDHYNSCLDKGAVIRILAQHYTIWGTSSNLQ